MLHSFSDPWKLNVTDTTISAVSGGYTCLAFLEGSYVQSSRSHSSPFPITEWQSGEKASATNKGIGQKPRSNTARGQMLVFMLQISSEQRPRMRCPRQRLHAAPGIFLKTKDPNTSQFYFNTKSLDILREE